MAIQLSLEIVARFRHRSRGALIRGSCSSFDGGRRIAIGTRTIFAFAAGPSLAASSTRRTTVVRPNPTMSTSQVDDLAAPYFTRGQAGRMAGELGTREILRSASCRVSEVSMPITFGKTRS